MNSIPQELMLVMCGYMDDTDIANINITHKFVNNLRPYRMCMNTILSKRIVKTLSTTLTDNEYIDTYQFMGLQEQLHAMYYVVTGEQYDTSITRNSVKVAKNIYNMKFGKYVKLRNRNLLAYI